MKLALIFVMVFICCIACNGRKKVEVIADKDSAVIKTDTAVLKNQLLSTTSSSAKDGGGLIEENGEIVYVSKNQYSFISAPYDFDLDASTIEGLLGKEAKTKVEEFEAGEDHSAYTYWTITFKDTEINFYDNPGKHFSNITTPLLPLKKGIKTGMKKDDFLNAMLFNDTNALKATVYKLVDDYGNVNFFFRSDVWYLIKVHYEEGD
jgi:hypothetical protein